MLDEIPAPVFVEWMAFYDADPFGEERADLRAGIIASTIANVMGGSKRRLQPLDFMPQFGAPRKQMSDADMKNTFKAAAAAWNSARKDAKDK